MKRKAEVSAPPSSPMPERTTGARWVLPYIDQPLAFWETIAERYGPNVREVYFPLPSDVISSGEPPQPSAHMQDFLKHAPLPRAVLLNPITLPGPVEAVAPRIIEVVRQLIGEYGVTGATVANLTLGCRVREAFPDLNLSVSCLMQISRPNQVPMLDGVFDALVPCNSIMRDLRALRAIKAAFPGSLRLLVNEGCLPGCPFRVQHFHEMCLNKHFPRSLCQELLEQHPWMRLTGGWVLPQHLHLFDGVYDDLKLGGRVTLRNPERYLQVLDAYIRRTPMRPNQIACGPGAVLQPIEISEAYYAQTLICNRDCTHCNICRDYYRMATQTLIEGIAQRASGAPTAGCR